MSIASVKICLRVHGPSDDSSAAIFSSLSVPNNYQKGNEDETRRKRTQRINDIYIAGKGGFCWYERNDLLQVGIESLGQLFYEGLRVFGENSQMIPCLIFQVIAYFKLNMPNQ